VATAPVVVLHLVDTARMYKALKKELGFNDEQFISYAQPIGNPKPACH
jgi:hypothetical protein